MGDFVGFANLVFKKDNAKNTVFYPLSIFGKGYILPSDEAYQNIFQFFKKTLKVFFPALVLMILILELVELSKYQILLNLSLPVLFIGCSWGWYTIFIKKTTKEMTQVQEKLNLSDMYEAFAESYSVPLLILIELFSLVFLVIAVWFILIKEYMITSCVAIVFFGLACYFIKNIIVKKIHQIN